ncbi:hypothetical protein [Eisenibacter elegans]|uniref:hypothetical protein n=1 Tax=Eisenibacter elegans TaxID=997 RepID=UPI00041365A6|nr:hypothetical protein [Eisenibacter elegans]
MKSILGKNRATYSLTDLLEALISPDNVVRCIDLFVESLDLAPLANFKPLIGKIFCTFQSIRTQYASHYELVSPWYSVF